RVAVAERGERKEWVVWDVETGKVISTLHIDANPKSASFNPDGHRIATVGHRMIQIWDVDTGRPLITIPLPHGIVASTEFSNDGSHLIVALFKTGMYEIYKFDSTQDRWRAPPPREKP